MNKKPYAWLDGIPDKSSDLYNDAGYLNEAEVQTEIGNYLDIDDATAGQVLTMGESGFPEWDDVASGGGFTYPTVETSGNANGHEVDTGNTWYDGKKIYCAVVHWDSLGSGLNNAVECTCVYDVRDNTKIIPISYSYYTLNSSGGVSNVYNTGLTIEVDNVAGSDFAHTKTRTYIKVTNNSGSALSKFNVIIYYAK